MKNLYILLITLLVFTFSNAQIVFDSKNVISDNYSPKTVYAADIDGDGDMDVLSGDAWNSGLIVWHENIDGLGEFDIQQIISDNTQGLRTIKAVDIDGDNDLDVLCASTFITDGKITWHENLDGLGNFGEEQIISAFEFTRDVHFTDVDGDGDMDILSVSGVNTDNSKVIWYENLDGLGSFFTQHIITANLISPISVFTEDIDGDGDQDVITNSYGDNSVAWLENTNGLGDFGPVQYIDQNVMDAYSVHANDVDGDGDMDVLSASAGDDKVSWYENTDGLGNFNPERIITNLTDGASSVYTSDIDGDGDVDVLSSSAIDNKVAWYENLDGLGNFGNQQIITTDAINAYTVYASDLNNDGKIDVLSASYTTNGKLAWYKNLGVLGIDENTQVRFTIYPNPAKEVLNIDSQQPIETIKIYNLQGQIVKEDSSNRVDVSQLTTGLYFVQVVIDGKTITKKFIKE